MDYLLVFCLLFAECGDHGAARTPGPQDLDELAAAYSAFLDKWDEVQITYEKRSWLIGKESERRLTQATHGRTCLSKNRKLSHIRTASDPKYIDSIGVTYGESMFTFSINNGEAEELFFSRGVRLDEPRVLSESDPFGPFGNAQMEWFGGFSSSPEYAFGGERALRGMRDVDTLAELRGPNAKVIARNHKDDLSGYEGTIRLEVVMNPDRRFELLFVRQDELYVPFGFDASITGMPVLDVAGRGNREILLRQSRRSTSVRERFLDRSNTPRLERTIFGEFHDGHSEREFEEVVFSELKFGKPPASAFVLPVSVPDGTEVLLEDTPQIKAEWRDGKVVEVYRGDVVRNIASAEMASKWPLWIYLLAAMAVIGVGIFFVWRVYAWSSK